MKKKASNVRAYSIENGIHDDAKEELLLLLSEYRETSEIIAKSEWRNFYTSGKFSKYLEYDVESKISERYKQTCHAQVVSMLKSFMSNRENDYRRIVYKSDISAERKEILLTINNNKAWFKQEDSTLIHKKEEIRVTKDDLKLARKILKHCIDRCRLPNFKNINLALDNKVCKTELNFNSKHWDSWLSVSCLIRNKPIKIPLKMNQYFAHAKGNMKNFVQINFIFGEIVVYFLKEKVDQLQYIPKCDSIGIDFGLCNLLTTNKGDLLGRNSLKKLISLDKQVINIVKLNPKGYHKTKRYKDLVKHTRNYLRNMLGKSLNKLVRVHAPKEIIVEELDFRDGRMSKQMNRILHNCGLGTFYAQLDRLKLDYGIAYTKVNPAYTSQTCSHCGYVDYKNRRKQANFICKCCGKHINADCNGGINIKARRSMPEINTYTGKKRVLNTLVKKFVKNIENKFTRIIDGIKKYSCPYKLSVIWSNPYFKDNFEEVKEFIKNFSILEPCV